MQTSDRVDRENKVIRGYSVMSLGEAKGHGMTVDETTLEQLVSLGNATPAGIKTRIMHPNESSDGFGRLVGRSRNFRREGDKVLADLHLSDAAFASPHGDYGSYLMTVAETDPDTFGSSPEIVYAKKQNSKGLPSMRIRGLSAIAIVDNPATNDGFFLCLSEGDGTMADNAELESKVAELSAKNADLSAERDLLAEEAVSLKARVEKLEGENKSLSEGKVAELAAARTEAISKTLTDERNRAADILALCGKSAKLDLSAKFIAEGASLSDVQAKLFDVLCDANKPIGEGSNVDLSAKNDADHKYKSEYAAQKSAYLSAGMSEDEYVQMRRVDDGVDSLVPNIKAA